MRRLSFEERRFALCLAALGALAFVGYRESVLGPPLAGLCALTAKEISNIIFNYGSHKWRGY